MIRLALHSAVTRCLPVMLMAVWATAVSADAVPPQISMNTGLTQYEPGLIRARVQDSDDVDFVRLYYRQSGDHHYNSIEMDRLNDVYYRNLKREFNVDGTVEYYLLAQDTSGNQATEPLMDPEENPMTTAVGERVNQSAPEVFLTSPEAGSVLDTGDEMVMVTLYNSGREVDFNTVRLKVDRRDRTREAELLGNVLVWQPRRPLADGVHEIEVVVRDTEGDYIGPNIWTFRVRTKRELPLGAEGDFYVGLQRDDRSGSSHNVPLWNNKVDMNLRGQSGFVNWTAGVMLSSEESSFLTTENLRDTQPINRYFIEGRTRNFSLRFGDSNPNFSDLSMKGILVRGLNLKFNSNRFMAQFIKGYNKRELDQDIRILYKNVIPSAENPDVFIDEDGVEHTLTAYQEIQYDSVNGKYHVYEFAPGTFQRDVTAFQVDVTPVRNKYANWTIGLNFFGAEDDSTSLAYSYDADNEIRTYSYGDLDFETDYKPKKNWAGTIETALRFNENRSEIAAEFGGTIVTNNMFGTLTEDMRDELPEDIDDETFRFNGSTQTSFDKLKIKDNVSEGAMDALTSVYKVRLTSAVPIPKTSTYFKGELYRIPTHYVSLGNPQQKTDIGGYKFDVRTRFLRDQVTLNVGYDTYSDNLDDERKQFAGTDPSTGAGTGQKNLTKDTNVASMTVTVRPNILPDYQPNVTLGLRNYTASNNLDLDIDANDVTNMVDTATNTFMLNFGGTIPLGLHRHNGTISISNMSITDDRPVEEYLLNESDNLTLMLNMNSTLNPMPLTISTSLGRTSNKAYRPLYDANFIPTGRSEITTDITILNMAATYKWFRDKRLRTTAGFGYLGSGNGESGDYEVDNTKFSMRVSAQYNLTSVLSVGGLMRYITYSDNANSANDYTEPIFGVNLSSTF